MFTEDIIYDAQSTYMHMTRTICSVRQSSSEGMLSPRTDN